MFASAHSDGPDFLFEILIEEGQRISLLAEVSHDETNWNERREGRVEKTDPRSADYPLTPAPRTTLRTTPRTTLRTTPTDYPKKINQIPFTE